MAWLLRSLGPKLVQQLRTRVDSPHFLQTAQNLSRTGQAIRTRGFVMATGGRVEGISVRIPPEDIPYAVKGLSHIAIAVPDLSVAAEHYRSAFGAQVGQPVEKADQGVTVVFARLPNVCIELVHPLGDGGPVAKFLQKNPKGGIHHICLEDSVSQCRKTIRRGQIKRFLMQVDDVAAASDYLKSEVGVGTAGNSAPTIGAEGKPILFLNPKDNQGVLIELQQANQAVAIGNEVHQTGSG